MCIWNMAADTFGFDDQYITDIVYANGTINRFLQAKNSMGIAACKGMGKTFLLKAKRLSMMNDSSYMFLPQNQLVDTPGPVILNNSQLKFLSSYSNWVSIWTFCISAYILSQSEFSHLLLEDSDVERLDKSIRDILSSHNEGVYHVLNRLLSKKTTKDLRIAIEAATLLFPILQRVNRQVILFVDKLEEPFNRGYYKIDGSSHSAEGKYNSSIWAYAQLAFAEAVYILYSGRHHIKIFYSIRQEALYGAESISVEYSKFGHEMITSIQYSYSDLYKMFMQYVEAEKDENLYDASAKQNDPCIALCGIDKIQHRSGDFEDLWAYMYRHSFARPRDIMEMSSALYSNILLEENTIRDKEQRIRVCRHWINQISTRICKEYIHILEPFMCFEDNLEFIQKIEQFLALLPTNVFTMNTMTAYCHKANKATVSVACSTCESPHFFSTLYNIGLLGSIYASSSEKGYKNKIKHIGDSVFSTTNQSLPSGKLFYAHPGLSNLIQEMRERTMQKYFPSNLIINGAETFVKEDQIVRAQHLADALLGNTNDKRVFLTSTERDLKNIRIHIKTLLERQGYEVMMFEEADFPAMPTEKTGIAATHDHCIDVVLSCKHLVYIYAGSFGGSYSGSDYKRYVDEQSIIKIKPSVSFVEYLVAKKYFKDVKVYVANSVDVARGEYIANGSPENYKSKAVNSPLVLTQLGYFNGLGNGTWYNTYSNINDLDKYLLAAFPQECNS